MHSRPALSRPSRFVALLTPALLLGALAAAPSVVADTAGGSDPEALYLDGQALIAQHNPGAAEMVFQRLVRLAPQHLRGRLALARLQLNHAPDEALANADAARVLDPNDADVHWLRGRALEALERLPEAAEAYRQVIRIDPRRLDAHRRLRAVLGLLRAGQTRVAEAAERFYAAPNLATLSGFGRLLLDEAPAQQALAELEEATQRVPALPELYLWIARVQHKAGSLDGEIEAYQRYLAAEPKAAGVRFWLAEHLQEAGRARAAGEVLEPFAADATLAQGLERPERARLAYVLSRVALAQLDLDGAARHLAEAARLGLDPALVRAAYRGDLTGAPDDAELWQGYGEWLAQSRESETAADAWLQAALLDAQRRPAARRALAHLAAPGRAPDAARLALARLALADGQAQEALTLADPAAAAPLYQRLRLLLQGLAHRALGDSSRSVDALTAYAAFTPDAQEIARARGVVLWETGDRASALAAWQERPEALGSDAEWLARIALYAQGAGASAAEQAFRERLAALPGVNPANRVRLGELYLAQGRTRDALAQWDAALAQNPRDFDLLLRAARQRYAMGDLEGGTARLLQANRLRPVPVDLALVLADIWRAQGRLGEALALDWQVYQVQPQEPKLRAALPELAAQVGVDPRMRRAAAALALETGRTELALSLLQSLLREDPADREARALLAEGYALSGRAAEAEALLEAAQPPLTGAERLRLLARMQRQEGDRAGLAGTLAQLAPLEPDNPALARERGVLLVQLGRIDEAEPLLAPLASRAGGDPELALALAQVDLARNRPAAAEAHVKEALAGRPDLPQAHWLLQQVYRQQGRWEDLGRDLEVEIGRDPRRPELREAAVTAYLRTADAPRARPHYEALRTLDPQRALRLAPYFP
ncbi:MAG: tetratricopeptide repeat protein [SAR324 cluster bacterium]